MDEELAFPATEAEEVGSGIIVTTYHHGLTKRELFAAMAMQGFAANPSCSANGERHVAEAVQWADALLAALAQPKQGKEGGEAPYESSQ